MYQVLGAVRILGRHSSCEADKIGEPSTVFGRFGVYQRKYLGSPLYPRSLLLCIST